MFADPIHRACADGHLIYGPGHPRTFTVMPSVSRILCRPFVALPLLALVATSAPSVNASVLGSWRFESGQFLTDSSGNGNNLTAIDAGSTPAQFTLPAAGNGSQFPDPLPGTGIANAFAAQFDGGDRLRAADNAAFTDTTLSIEAFVNISAIATSQLSIAGHWNSTGNQRSYLFAANGATTQATLNFLFSTNGIDTTIVTSPFTLVTNTDYYVGVTVNLADTSANGITFYIQNLTAGGSLQSAGVAHSGTTFINANTAFTIGSTDQPSSLFSGLIDEVRVSDTKLASSELMVVPEPSCAALLGLGALLAARRRR